MNFTKAEIAEHLQRERKAKLKADLHVLDTLDVGASVMTHDGKRWKIGRNQDGERTLVPDLRSRKQRRRDNAKARK